MIECIGGPYDGETRGDRGHLWRVVRETWSGTYTRHGAVYRWVPD